MATCTLETRLEYLSVDGDREKAQEQQTSKACYSPIYMDHLANTNVPINGRPER